MKRLLFAILCLAILVSNVFVLEAKAEYDLSAYFPLDQGDTWVYKTVYSGQEDKGIFEEKVWIDGVEAINGQDTLKIFTKKERFGFIRDAGYDYFAVDSEGVKLYQHQERLVEPFELIFPAQIEIGNTVQSFYIVAASDDPENPAESKRIVKKITLEGVEDIGVKAGEFNDCLNFSFEKVKVLDSGRKSIENSKVWLAPNIGIIRQTTSIKYIEPDGASREKFIDKELKGALVRGVNVGEEVKVEVGKEEKAGEQEEILDIEEIELPPIVVPHS